MSSDGKSYESIIFIIIGIIAMIALYGIKASDINSRKQQRSIEEMQRQDRMRKIEKELDDQKKSTGSLEQMQSDLEEEKLRASERDGAYGTHAGHEYVDLGLSVKWANCNIGASSPEKAGVYFAWGESEPKTDYDAASYSLGHSSGSGSHLYLKKYNTVSALGIRERTDNRQVLEPEDDAATVKWGEGWRIPTSEEFKELREYCEWEWDSRGGVNGYRVTSSGNGNSIFLPVTGYVANKYTGRYSTGKGFYWSASLKVDYPRNAFILELSSDDISEEDMERTHGITIRPVLDAINMD